MHLIRCVVHGFSTLLAVDLQVNLNGAKNR